MAKKKTKAQTTRAEEPAGVPAGTKVAVAIGQYFNPDGPLGLEIGPGPKPKQVIVRVQGKFDFWFEDGAFLGCGTVAGNPTPLLVPLGEQPKRVDLLVPERPKLILATH